MTPIDELSDTVCIELVRHLHPTLNLNDADDPEVQKATWAPVAHSLVVTMLRVFFRASPGLGRQAWTRHCQEHGSKVALRLGLTPEQLALAQRGVWRVFTRTDFFDCPRQFRKDGQDYDLVTETFLGGFDAWNCIKTSRTCQAPNQPDRVLDIQCWM